MFLLDSSGKPVKVWFKFMFAFGKQVKFILSPIFTSVVNTEIRECLNDGAGV